MNRRITRGLAMAGVMALPLSFVTGAQGAAPTQERVIRPADVKEDRSTAPGGFEILREGVLMSAPDGDSRAGIYWELAGGEFPSSASFEWTGTQKTQGQESFADPATVVFFDVDGTGPLGREALLMEDIYGGDQDAWLASASGQSQEQAPIVGGGSGSEYHGPLDEWKANLEAEYPDLTVVQVGVNLSSEGEVSEGHLRSVTFDDTLYTFTDTQPTSNPQPPSCPQPPTPDPDPEPDPDPTPDPDPEPEPAPAREDVRGSVSAERDGRTLDLVLSSRDSRADGADERNKLRWRIAVAGESSATYVQGFDEVDGWNRTFRDGTGRYVVRVFKNGENVREYEIRTGR